MLRYYEEQGLLHPGREENGYRCYSSGTVELVQQIRIAVHPDCLPETAALLQQEAERIQGRIDCLARNRDAIRGYLDGIRQHPR